MKRKKRADEMTKKSLNEVRELRARLKLVEILIEGTESELGAAQIVGGGTSKGSKVERLLLKRERYANEVTRLKLEIERAMTRLEVELRRLISDGAELELMLLRYVDCVSFHEIARYLGYSESHVFYLHRKIIKIIVNNS